MKKIDNFLSNGSTGWELAQPVRRISIEVHYSSRFKFEAPELVFFISPSFELEIMHCLFLWIPYSLRNIIPNVNKLLNQLDWLETGSSGSLCQLVQSTNFGDFGFQILLG